MKNEISDFQILKKMMTDRKNQMRFYRKFGEKEFIKDMKQKH